MEAGATARKTRTPTAARPTPNVPAAIAKVVLAAAMQDFIDEVRPTDFNDWLTLVRSARTASRERIEDYVAAATAAGPLIAEPAPSSSQP